MKTLDELVADKILDLMHYVLSKFIKPDMTLNKVNELDVQAIEKLKQQYGIEAIILDVKRQDKNYDCKQWSRQRYRKIFR